MLEPQTTLNCNGTLVDVSTPIVMGILNITPDSFYDGGKYQQQDAILKRVDQMLEEGVSIIDVGGMSSRPGAAIITKDKELQRVLPTIELILKKYPKALISIDTVQSEVAQKSIELGAVLINDISAGRLDTNLYKTVAQFNAPYVLMHMKGQPSNMQNAPEYEDVNLEILDFFIQEIGKLRALGVKDIIIDPGFGFGKSTSHNFQILKNLHIFKILDVPIMVGLSRKSMIYKSLDIKPKEALNGTSVLHLAALQQGASILRVHDVKEAIETITLYQLLQG